MHIRWYSEGHLYVLPSEVIIPKKISRLSVRAYIMLTSKSNKIKLSKAKSFGTLNVVN